ncbi:inactive protein kinase [Prunus yedoensis var. nudiflora]|uniref:Inactive protein kinase n=1 Tax=Prunus yedoensis var. nudiflora TaxID=2094558 RepID=A0A314XYQ2_PRUYE|nr:inactive protein kinase [Prunus yedoensis var. nudiflora]
MQIAGMRPSEYTFSIVMSLVTCSCHGKQIHGGMIRNGMNLSNLILGNSLIDMYGKLGCVDYAFGVFFTMEDVDIITWNSLISACHRSGYAELALDQFFQMRSTKHSPDEYTISSVINVCCNLPNLEKGKQIFAFCLKVGFLSNSIVSSAAIDLFSKCNRLEDAIRLFEELDWWDSAVCNSMISSYARHDCVEDAVLLFVLTLRENLRPTEFTLSSLLNSASIFLPAELGSQIHSLVVKLDLTSWNTMIMGMAHNGKVFETLNIFEELISEGIAPDKLTLAGVLLACNLGGLVDEGMTMFLSMEKEYGIVPQDEHYMSIVDLLSSTVAQRMMQSEAQSSLPYSVLARAYEMRGRWESMIRVRKAMKLKGVRNVIGCSKIGIQNHVYTFKADQLQPHRVSMASPMTPSHVVIAYDATRDRGEPELELTVDSLRMRGDILHSGDTIILLGVLHRVVHPLGFHSKPSPEFFGTSIRAVEEEVTKKVDVYVNMLLQSAKSVKMKGSALKSKLLLVFPLNRHLRRDLRFYLKQIPCKVAIIQDSLAVEVMRPHTTDDTDTIEHKLFYSLSKPVPHPANGNSEHSSIACRSYSVSVGALESSDMLNTNLMTSSTFKLRDYSPLLDPASSSKQENSGAKTKGDNKHSIVPQINQKQNKNVFQHRSSEAPILCSICGTRTEMYIKDSMTFSYSEIQLATNDFSKENLLGEGGYGHVYKGELKDGQQIAAKVRKEASQQGFTEFHSEVYVLSFARHKNIVMLLGYCCKENLNILVYEYICNNSLEWHLFDDNAAVLEWHQRHAIAIGTAKGLRFLHEECRGGPIIHRDMRPSNILLTHDYVPMLGDFGLAKWKISDDPVQTRILGTLGYLAPEYAENGIVSVRTDVYSFGMVLLQLISGRKIIDSKRKEKEESLRQWAEPIIRRLALHELIDRRIGDSYDTYEVYLMAKAAYLCVQRSPEMRPSMGEVVRILEGENDHFHHLGEHFVPHYTK